MRRFNGSPPLAFLLAMAVEATGAPVPGINEAKPTLEAGMLSGLLREVIGAPAINAVEDWSASGSQVVQFFPNFPNFSNFVNCFAGNWRNC